MFPSVPIVLRSTVCLPSVFPSLSLVFASVSVVSLSVEENPLGSMNSIEEDSIDDGNGEEEGESHDHRATAVEESASNKDAKDDCPLMCPSASSVNDSASALAFSVFSNLSGGLGGGGDGGVPGGAKQQQQQVSQDESHQLWQHLLAYTERILADKSEAESRAAHTKAEMRWMARQHQQLADERRAAANELRQECAELRLECAELRQECAGLREECSKLREDLSRSKADLEERDARVDSMQSNAVEIKNYFADREEELRQRFLREKEEAVSEERRKGEAKAASASAALEVAKKRQGRCQETEEELARWRDRCRQVEEDLQGWKGAFFRAKVDYESSQTGLKSVKEELARYRAEAEEKHRKDAEEGKICFELMRRTWEQKKKDAAELKRYRDGLKRVSAFLHRECAIKKDFRSKLEESLRAFNADPPLVGDGKEDEAQMLRRLVGAAWKKVEEAKEAGREEKRAEFKGQLEVCKKKMSQVFGFEEKEDFLGENPDKRPDPYLTRSSSSGGESLVGMIA